MSARISQRDQDNKSLLRKRLAYTLAAGAAVAVLDSPTSQAVIVYSGPQDIDILQGQRQSIEFDTDIYVDLILKNYIFSGVNYQGLTVNFSPGAVAGFQVGNVDYVSALALGTIVDAATAGPDFKGSMAHGAVNPNAQFNDITDGYIGLSFPIGGALPENLHYAWMRVDIENSAGTFIVRDWAWEDEAGVAITVGDTGQQTVPGDFDSDEDVDGKDFLAWQRGLSPQSLSLSDLQEWQENYGTVSAITAHVSAAPEPVTLGMLAAGSPGVLLLRRLRNR